MIVLIDVAPDERAVWLHEVDDGSFVGKLFVGVERGILDYVRQYDALVFVKVGLPQLVDSVEPVARFEGSVGVCGDVHRIAERPALEVLPGPLTRVAPKAHLPLLLVVEVGVDNLIEEVGATRIEDNHIGPFLVHDRHAPHRTLDSAGEAVSPYRI